MLTLSGIGNGFPGIQMHWDRSKNLFQSSFLYEWRCIPPTVIMTFCDYQLNVILFYYISHYYQCLLSHIQLFVTLWLTRLLCPWNFPGKNTEVGCHFLLQGIFLTQGLNLCLLCLLHWLVNHTPVPPRKPLFCIVFIKFRKGDFFWSIILH